MSATATPDHSSDLARTCRDLARRARAAAALLATARPDAKDRWLHRAADALLNNTAELEEANERDLEAAEQNGLSEAQIDRLRLTPGRVRAAAEGLRQV